MNISATPFMYNCPDFPSQLTSFYDSMQFANYMFVHISNSVIIQPDM